MKSHLKDASLASGDISEFQPFAEKLMLTCTACGRRKKYAVGSIFWAPDQNLRFLKNWRRKSSFEDEIAFGGYFRCVDCHSPGPWKFPEQTSVRLLELALNLQDNPEDSNRAGFYYGVTVLFDGTRSSSPAWAEDYLRRLIEKSPQEYLLHNRLGNILLKAGLEKEAQAEFEQAIRLNPEEVSSLNQLGDLALEAGDQQKAIKYFQQVLRHARNCDYLKERERRRIVDNTLQCLLEMDALNQVLETLAMENRLTRSAESTATVYLTQFDLDQDADRQQFIEMFLDRPEDHPPQGKTLLIPPFMEAARFPGMETVLEYHPELTDDIMEEAPDEFERLSPILRESTKISRNEPCPCGSGKKYKRCCGKN